MKDDKEKQQEPKQEVKLEDLQPEEEATEDVRGGQGFALLTKGG